MNASSNGISAIVCLREVSKRSDAEQRQRSAQMVREVDCADTAGRSNDLRTEFRLFGDSSTGALVACTARATRKNTERHRTTRRGRLASLVSSKW